MIQQEIDFRIISEPDELFELAGAWESLWSITSGSTPFSAPDWLLCWFEVFWKNEWQLLSLVGFHNGELCVLVPMYTQPPQTIFDLSYAYPLGQGEDEIEEICSEYLEILVSPNFEDSARRYVADWLKTLDVDIVRWHSLQNDEFTRPFLCSLSNTKTNSKRRYMIAKENWSIGDLSRSTKYRWKRLRDKLQLQGAQFSWVLGSDQDALWPTLAELHRRRWQAKGKAGAFYLKKFSEFHTKYRHRTQYDRSCMSCLRINGEPIAMNYYVLDQDTLYFYQSGWNIDFANLSPGFALHMWSIQNTDRRYYDFMISGPTKSYKTIFEPSQIETFDVEVRLKPVIVGLKQLGSRLAGRKPI